METESLTRDKRRVELRTVPPIDRSEAQAIAENVFCERYHRTPNPAALKVLLDKRNTTGAKDQSAHGNPLWLELALQEMNLLEGDDFTRADLEFAHHPGGRADAAVAGIRG